MIQMFTKKRKGFTLIELIVVIAILAILMLIAVPRFSGTQETAKTRSCQATQRTIESAAALYEAETGAQPENITALVNGDYLADTPACPSSGTYTLTDGVVSCSVAGHAR